jgi:pyruvate/2-oxoglutarate dehydrogenase complex dihydrolipoamide acyltransferase (E2) component
VAADGEDAAEGAPEDKDTAAVGYGKPPQHTRFQKGRSGNPGGQPRRSRRARDLAALLSVALDTPSVITEEGRRRRATKREVIAAQLVDRSAQADLHATKLLVDIMHKIEQPREAERPLDADDEKVIAALLARLGRK